MTDLDQEIEEALDAEDRALHRELGEQGIFAQWFSVYHGPQRWTAIMTTGAMLVAMGVAVYAILQAMNVDNEPDVIRWGGLAMLMILIISFMKVWFWMRMEANRVIREVKRLELQIARLQLK